MDQAALAYEEGLWPKLTSSGTIRSAPRPCFSTRRIARNRSAKAGDRAYREVKALAGPTPPTNPAGLLSAIAALAVANGAGHAAAVRGRARVGYGST